MGCSWCFSVPLVWLLGPLAASWEALKVCWGFFFPQASDCGFSNLRLRTQGGIAGYKIQNPAAGSSSGSASGCPPVFCCAVVCFGFFVFRRSDLRYTTMFGKHRFCMFSALLCKPPSRLTVCFLNINFSRLRRGDFRYTTIS